MCDIDEHKESTKTNAFTPFFSFPRAKWSIILSECKSKRVSDSNVFVHLLLLIRIYRFRIYDNNIEAK